MSQRVLVCAYFAKNLGDDLFLKILFDRYPHVKWDLLTANRNYNKIFKEYKNVRIIYSYRELNIGRRRINLFFKWNDLLFKYKKYDALVNIGGSIFMQGPAWKQKWSEREYLVDSFKKVGKGAFILGANFGPYHDKRFVNQYRKLFRKYDDVCFRDTYSYRIFRNLGNVRMASDIVFTLHTRDTDKSEKSIGMSVINLEKREGLKEYDHPYNNTILELAKSYITQGYKVKLFSFCENEGDLNMINSIVKRVNPNNRNDLKVINYEGDIGKILNELQTCEKIVGTRFHSIILAMIHNQEFYPIIYSDKTLNLLRDIKVNQFCSVKDIGNLDVKDVIAGMEHNKVDNQRLLLDANKQFHKLDHILA